MHRDLDGNSGEWFPNDLVAAYAPDIACFHMPTVVGERRDKRVAWPNPDSGFSRWEIKKPH